MTESKKVMTETFMSPAEIAESNQANERLKARAAANEKIAVLKVRVAQLEKKKFLREHRDAVIDTPELDRRK